VSSEWDEWRLLFILAICIGIQHVGFNKQGQLEIPTEPLGEMSLSAVLTFATFIAGQTLSCTVFRRLRELGRKDLGRDEPMSLLGCLAVALGSAFSVYFGVYCAALTARRDDSYHSGMRPPRLPINTFARAVCNYEGIQEHELSIKAGQTIEITIAQEYG
jgi:hypothetical protein